MMDVVWDLFIGFTEIFALIIGVLGTILALLLILAPRKAVQISRVFNRSVDVDKKISLLDKTVNTDRFIYKHNILAGVCIIVGSALTLVFLLFSFDADQFVGVFFGQQMYVTTHEIIISALAILGKLAGILGLLMGSVLLFTPEQLKRIEQSVSLSFSTQSMVDKLDQTQKDIDSVVFRQPRLFGAIGLVFSIILLILAIDNLT